MMKKDNIMNREMGNIIRDSKGSGGGFDETIKRMAEQVMSMINTQKKEVKNINFNVFKENPRKKK